MYERGRARRAKVPSVAFLASALLLLTSIVGGATVARSAQSEGACPRVDKPVRTGALASAQLDEISGLVASRSQSGLYWVHNDSGDQPRVFAIDLTGALRAELKLTGAEARDYEDIARAPGARPGEDVLYVADIGDNLARRKSVQLYRVPEPRLKAGAPAVLSAPATRIDVVYEDGPHDAEALLADPIDGDLYLVAKAGLFSLRREVGVYRLPADELRAGKVVARRIAKLPLGPVTAGDITADGAGVLIRNYVTALYFRRRAGESIAQALARPGCTMPLGDAGLQGESLGFAADGASYVTVSEGAGSPIYRHTFVAP